MIIYARTLRDKQTGILLRHYELEGARMTYTERFLSSLIALISILRRPILAGRELLGGIYSFFLNVLG